MWFVVVCGWFLLELLIVFFQLCFCQCSDWSGLMLLCTDSDDEDEIAVLIVLLSVFISDRLLMLCVFWWKSAHTHTHTNAVSLAWCSVSALRKPYCRIVIAEEHSERSESPPWHKQKHTRRQRDLISTRPSPSQNLALGACRSDPSHASLSRVQHQLWDHAVFKG